MDELRKAYDIIIIDSPPVSAVTDALILATLSDKIVIVCSYGKTPSDLLKETKKSLESVSNKIAGIVVNKMKREKNSKYYGDGYYE